jgi:hypothetical protein
MFDALERILILTVFSHQLNRNFTNKTSAKQPSPNLCIVSANQYADNAATQAREIIGTLPRDFELIFILYFHQDGALPLKNVLLLREQQKFCMKIG